MIQCDDGYEADSAGKCVNCCKSSCGAFEHVPNLCVVHKVCTQCMDTDVTTESECDNCGKNERVFRGDNTVNEFCLCYFRK